MKRRQRVLAAKAHFLNDAADAVETVADTYADTAAALGLPVADVEAAASEVRQQLMAWAYRITPMEAP